MNLNICRETLETTLTAQIPDLMNPEFVFHPIVHVHTGHLFGVEAVFTGFTGDHSETRNDLFDGAREKGLHHQADLLLRQKILTRFSAFRKENRGRVFLRLDHRVCRSPDYRPGRTLAMIEQLGLISSDICFVLQMTPDMIMDRHVVHILDRYRSQGFRTAVSGYDIRFHGVQVLDRTAPDYLILHRDLYRDFRENTKTQQAMSFVITYSHLADCRVIAGEVQTEEEFIQCREWGCDLIQGDVIQQPGDRLGAIKTCYDTIRQITRKDRRNHVDKNRCLTAGEITYLEPVSFDCTVVHVFDQFRTNPHTSFFPVIDQNGEPLGIVRETAFKEYFFSRFGRQLLENPSFGRDISRFVTRIPVADVHASLETLIEIYTRFNNNEGLIMVDNLTYIGVLSTNSLLKLINEKQLIQARDQNPLTQLPGNNLIHDYLSSSLSDEQADYHLIYFDFDHFKAFNDRYGFRSGDRVILMFAELLKKTAFSENRFVGHVGGDDFFMGIRNSTLKTVEDQMAALAREFKKNVESFYDFDTVKKGYLAAVDREGKKRNMPLMTVSVAILELAAGDKKGLTVEDMANTLAGLKKKAKRSGAGIASARALNRKKQAE
jgi:diguanylate cyclase (GGDEF)-like protein